MDKDKQIIITSNSAKDQIESNDNQPNEMQKLNQCLLLENEKEGSQTGTQAQQQTTQNLQNWMILLQK